MKNILKIGMLAISVVAVASCDLSEYNPNEYSPAMAFGTAESVQMGINVFYSAFPSVTNAYSKDGSSDFLCTPYDFANRFCVGYDASASDLDMGGFDRLREINYFLEHMDSPACGVSGAVKANFVGQGRMFRALWYSQKMFRYGDMPWYDRVIRSDEPDYEWKERESRDEIIKHIIDDLDYAATNITAKSTDRTGVTRDVALFIKMRACLNEASFRKYNNVTTSVLGKPFSNYTVEALYREAADAAEKIMHSAEGYSLVDNYRDLFISDKLQAKEVILGAQTASTLKGSQNVYYNGTDAGRSFNRNFINTYLMSDGTPYTSKATYATETFSQEFVNRDPRLAKIVRTPGYKFDGKAVAPVLPTTAPIGYHIIKFTIDKAADGNGDLQGGNNTNSTPIYRYSEVLLAYAEAKAELGEMTDAIWAQTVGAIRKRAGITGGNSTTGTLTTAPTGAPDAYLKANVYPTAETAVIMEIRRERGCELCLEGTRANDMLRWGCGEIIAKAPWTGINIPALDTPVDLDGDGTNDYYFSESADAPASYDATTDGTFVQVNKRVANQTSLEAISNGSVLQLRYEFGKQRNWDANNRLILDPIPALLVEKYKDRGYTFTQNPGY